MYLHTGRMIPATCVRRTEISRPPRIRRERRSRLGIEASRYSSLGRLPPRPSRSTETDLRDFTTGPRRSCGGRSCRRPFTTTGFDHRMRSSPRITSEGTGSRSLDNLRLQAG
jgi:hypothetical protein